MTFFFAFPYQGYQKGRQKVIFLGSELPVEATVPFKMLSEVATSASSDFVKTLPLVHFTSFLCVQQQKGDGIATESVQANEHEQTEKQYHAETQWDQLLFLCPPSIGAPFPPPINNATGIMLHYFICTFYGLVDKTQEQLILNLIKKLPQQ